uniref:Metallo-beta-lactamase domain-containing protein n=1 Tax=Plectus sambesii TaxID=2011161 RepID=A0A914WKC1_9BILA
MGSRNSATLSGKNSATLAQNGLRPEEVQIVVVTHGYPVHFGQSSSYKNARQYFSTFEYNGKGFDRTSLYERGEMPITPSVTLWSTPGHAPEDISAIVHNVPGRGTLAIVGELIHDADDALDSRNWERKASSAHIGRRNRNKVICAADYILPGHGSMFQVTGHMRAVAGCTGGREGSSVHSPTPTNLPLAKEEKSALTTERSSTERNAPESPSSQTYPDRYWWEYESDYQRRLHHYLRLEHHRRQQEHRRTDEERRRHEEHRIRLEHHRRLQEHHHLQEGERRQSHHQQLVEYHRRLQEHQRLTEEQRRRDEHDRRLEEHKRREQERLHLEHERLSQYHRQVEQHRREQERQRQIDEQRRRHHQHQLEHHRRVEE